MAYQSIIGGGGWIPNTLQAVGVGASTYVIDATGEKAVLVFVAPKAGDIDRFDFHVGAVGNTPDNLRASLQGVNAADGQNDGTILGATNNAFVTYAATVTTGWKSTNFGEVATVTRGQRLAAVIDIPSFTASDSVTISHGNQGLSAAFPYGLSIVGTKQASSFPLIALHYTDGYAYISAFVSACDTAPAVTYNSGTGTADEWALVMQLPFPFKINRIGFWAVVGAGADYEVVVYAADGTTVLATTAMDGDITGSVSSFWHEVLLQTELSVAKDTEIYVSIRPTTANSVALEYLTFQSLELMDTVEGGQTFYMASQLNQGGTWTKYNTGTFRRPQIAVQISAADDAVSAGGGGGPVVGARLIG